MALDLYSVDVLKSLSPNTRAVSIPGSVLIEWAATKSSSSVYVYDLAEHIGFGANTKGWKEGETIGMQTRAGAGLNLIGRLSEEGTSRDVKSESVLTAYNTPNGLATMADALAYTPSPTPSRRLVVHVPTLTPVGASLELSPTLAPLVPVINTLPNTFTVFSSASPQECVDLAALSYRLNNAHVIHLFDHYTAARELRPLTLKTYPTAAKTDVSVKEAFLEAGYDYFDYIGDANATDVIVMLNGPLALAAKTALKESTGVGLVVVRVLRPWDEQALLDILPNTVKKIHVVDEVPVLGVRGLLFADVLLTVTNNLGASVKSAQVVPARTQEFLKNPLTLAIFLQGLTPRQHVGGDIDIFPTSSPVKKALFFGTPSSPIALLPQYVANSFPAGKPVSARLLTEYDALSKPGGLLATRILFAPSESKDDLPLTFYLPLGGNHDTIYGKADLLAVLDHSLFKSHTILPYLRQGGLLVVFTSWSAQELVENLPTQALAYIRDKKISLCRIDVKTLAEDIQGLDNPREDLQTIFAHLAFLRLYLGQAATEPILKQLARTTYGSVFSQQIVDKFNARVWSALEPVQVSNVDLSVPDLPLKQFEFNAVNLSYDDARLDLPGAQLSNWHAAAKHILFPDAFVSPEDREAASDPYAQNPALRPEVPERTFLITCAVNRRLTPVDYDRYVFHLEFDTAGTGLKYEIGEALGVHGWNDTQEVLDFCQWYEIDPDKLVTIPVPNTEGKTHTRTVFQALQQQIDLFGHPPKSFYTDLAQYATKKHEKLALLFIGSAEGQATYKKLSEKDTVTFADILRAYPSAHPDVQVLCGMIGDIKPRHYSIASAQSVVGDRVDLLIVTVEWNDPKGVQTDTICVVSLLMISLGKPRFGQCTRYLSGLKVGQKVTVSIKPSVMKVCARSISAECLETDHELAPSR